MTKHTDPVSLFLQAVVDGTGVPTGLYADDAVLDATTPGWRFTQHGPDRVAGQLSAWFADPGTLTELRRDRVATGEVVSFTLSWAEDGEPWMAHQVHVVDVADGRITRQEAWCGGRWDAQRQHAIADATAVAR
jgi:ketosteroid isomerase-like protein